MRGFGKNISHFAGLVVRERGRGKKKEIQVSFDDPRSSFGRNSSSQEPKFIILMRATRGYKKMRDFVEDPKEEIWGNHSFWA